MSTNTKKKQATPKKYPLIAFRPTVEQLKGIEKVAVRDKVSKSSVIKSALESYLAKSLKA